jgi:hypothetical protein
MADERSILPMAADSAPEGAKSIKSAPQPDPGAEQKPLSPDPAPTDASSALASDMAVPNTLAASDTEEKSSLDPEVEEEIKKAVGPEIITSSATLGVALLGSIISMLIAINYKNRTMAGDQDIHPTKSETDISSVETTATETDATLAQDNVSGVQGEVLANETEARASTTEATALDSGVAAARTKAGALNSEQKALEML